MSEYISKEEALKIVDFEEKWLSDTNKSAYDVEIAFHGLKKKIESAPSADVRPNIHGYWIDCGCMYGYGNTSFRKYKCSACRDKVYEQPMNIKYHKFCLHCGAIMDGEPKGEKGTE